MPNSDPSQKIAGKKLTMTPLNYLSAARFKGVDAASFLHTQVSADIAALATGEASFACYCSPKGKVIGLLLICRRDDDFIMVAASELLPRILERLKIFVMRAHVEFSVQPDLAVQGATAESDVVVTDAFRPAGLPLNYAFLENTANGTGESFKAEELLNQVAWLGEATTEKYIPQMLGFDQIGAVSFSKGCYPGQEIVARARYLGKVKRKPVVVEVAENLPVQPLDRVEVLRENEWQPGIIVDSVPVSGGGLLLFVVAPAEPEASVVELKYQDRVYRCATM